MNNPRFLARRIVAINKANITEAILEFLLQKADQTSVESIEEWVSGLEKKPNYHGFTLGEK